MKSKDLLNILDRVKGFRAGDVEKATNLIKNLCERDNSVSVTSYSKRNNEYFECPSCGTVKTIQFLSNSKKDFEIFCSDCGQRINVIRYKKNISVGDIVKIKTFEEDTILQMNIRKVAKILDHLDLDNELIIRYAYNKYIEPAYHKHSHLKVLKLIPSALLDDEYSRRLYCLVENISQNSKYYNDVYIVRCRDLEFL